MSGVRVSIIAAAVAALLVACGKKDDNAPPPSPPTEVLPATKAIGSLDSLYDELATRVNTRVGGASEDFLVTPVPFGEWEVGTVLEQNRSIPVTFSACSPAPDDREVRTLDVPTLFPSYSMDRSVSVEAGLDEAVFDGIASANANVSFGQTVGLSIAGAQTRMWSNVGFNGMLKTAACREKLQAGTTYRLVRGLILGKRQFAFGVKIGGGTKLSVPKVANFKVDVGDGSRVTVSDEDSAGFLAVVSQFTLPQDQAQPAALAKPEASPTAEGNIYVQSDADEDVNQGRSVVSSLKSGGLNVDSRVQKIASAKMPGTAQVRYFRGEDEAKARQVLETLKAQYPDAKLVALRIPSPPGQVEVWLPKTGGAVKDPNLRSLEKSRLRPEVTGKDLAVTPAR